MLVLLRCCLVKRTNDSLADVLCGRFPSFDSPSGISDLLRFHRVKRTNGHLADVLCGRFLSFVFPGGISVLQRCRRVKRTNDRLADFLCGMFLSFVFPGSISALLRRRFFQVWLGDTCVLYRRTAMAPPRGLAQGGGNGRSWDVGGGADACRLKSIFSLKAPIPKFRGCKAQLQ